MIEHISEHSPPPPIAPPPSWGVKALGHLWLILTFIPVQIFSLLLKIKDIFLCCSFAETEVSKEKHKITATREPIPPTTTFPLKKEEGSKIAATDSLPDLRYVATPPQTRQVADAAEPNLDLSSLFVEHEPPVPSPTQEKEVAQEKEIQTEIALQPVSKEVTEAPQQITEVEVVNKPKEPVAIDVPNDGNCLFYACAVGIRKKYHNIPAIQEKLAWEVDPSTLTGDLSKQADLLKKPGTLIRQQSSDFLLANMEDELVMNALLGAIYEHNPKFERRITEMEASIKTLLQDIDKLQNKLQTASVESQLMQKIEAIEDLRKNIKEQQQNLVDTDNIPAYIEKSKQDRFYCDSPHIYAIGRLFGVPIKVLINYNEKAPANEKDQPFDIYNSEAIHSSTPITIAHVHGNHYMYIDT